MQPFKRKNYDRPTDPYYVKFMVKGRLYFRSTETTNKAEAIKRGREMRKLVVDEKWNALRGIQARGNVSTLGQVFEVYDKVATGITAKCRNQAKSALLRLLNAKETSSVEVLFKVDDIEPRFLASLPDSLTQPQVVSRKRTYNSMLRHAKAIFARRYRRSYSDLNLPDLKPLLEMPGLRVSVEPWTPPTHDVIDGLAKGLADLEAKRDPLALVVILAAYAGMRSNEIIHARWEWIGSAGIRIAPDRDFNIKGFSSRIVPLTEDAKSRLEALRTTVDYIIPGTCHTQRQNFVKRDATKWLRTQGIVDKKPLHALRKLYGSAVATDQGIYAAQRGLGHSNPGVTNRSYASLLEPIDAVSPLGTAQPASSHADGTPAS